MHPEPARNAERPLTDALEGIIAKITGDEDAMLILMLLVVLYTEGADKPLLFALLYILL